MTLITLIALFSMTAQLAPAQKSQETKSPLDDAFAIQVVLDRAGFSPGVIDGRAGANTDRALAAYRKQHGRDPEPSPSPLISYRITADDVSGPFVRSIPSDLMAQSKLPALAYRTTLEALAERFHTTPEALQRLNRGVGFNEGDEIKVPNVDPLRPPAADATGDARAVGTAGKAGTDKDVVVTVSRSGALTVRDASDRIVFFAPVTTGTDKDPLPIGEWKINGVQYSPKFHYNPDLFWDADPSHSRATIPPGPNNPVGLVWIDISKEHYGIHGTPEPSRIGATQSHGCVRLTNWDVVRLAGLVRPGTKVVFTE
jgi:lipoprotein-anchoring transpeptidase ErfK/SrfK